MTFVPGQQAAEASWAVGVLFIGLLFGVAAAGLLVWAFIDAFRNPVLGDVERVIWILGAVAVPCLGPAVYLSIGRGGTPVPARVDNSPIRKEDAL